MSASELKYPEAEALIKRITRPLFFKLYLLEFLPIGLFAGLKIKQVSLNECSITVPYKWLNKNPFRSIYFAVLAMAGEVSTGVLGLLAVYNKKPAVSMLVVNVEGTFSKKATGKIIFICKNGEEIFNAVDKTIATGEAQTIKCMSVGTDLSGDEVARFYITWSFKQKR